MRRILSQLGSRVDWRALPSEKRWRRLALPFVACILVAGAVNVSTDARAVAAARITLPDLRINVPTNDISIGTNPDTGHRQLQYTHVTWDAGTGPFEIQPTYDPLTGMANFVQTIYKSPRPRVWKADYKVSLSATGVFDPPSDYRFPLTKFTLNNVNGDGSPGSVVATSPKTDYCITADTFVGGVANTPNRTAISPSACTNPKAALGFSVGWGDEYDQTDRGQPIDLTGVPNGTYVLHAVVDPLHVFTESNRTNNVVDTKLEIAGNSVTVLSQTSPITSPPNISVTSPVAGAKVSGTLTLQASASAVAPATVSSVQFLLDGQPLGAPVTSSPYQYQWTVGSTPVGLNTLSAEATDSNGNVATAPVRTVIVTPSSSSGLTPDAAITKIGRTSVTAKGLSTTSAGDTVLAFVSADGPQGAGMQAATVSGAGLAWRLVSRANRQSGDAEVWKATAASTLTRAKVRSKLARSGYDQELTVLALRDGGGVSASAIASAPSGAPAVGLTTTAAGSMSYAVGDDWDNAIGRTTGPGQSLVSQWVDTGSGDTFWVQGTSSPDPASGDHVTLGDTAPTADEWNLVGVEVVPKSGAQLDAAPRVLLSNPVGGQTVSGTVSVAATASADVAVRSVQFMLDSKPLGSAVTTAPYVVRWNTTGVPAGTHSLSAIATDTSGVRGGATSVTTTVENPAPAMTCFVMQAQVSAHGKGTVTTPSFHTAAPGETMVALVTGEGPRATGKSGRQHATVTGAGLRWRLVKRANSGSGDAEIWSASARTVLAGATVTSSLAKHGFDEHVTVIAMGGVDGVGASSAASSTAGAPDVEVRTISDTSLVFAVGEGGGTALRSLSFGWVPLNEWTDTATHETSWSQYTNDPTGESGTLVTVRDEAPTNGPWNMVAVELVNDDS